MKKTVLAILVAYAMAAGAQIAAAQAQTPATSNSADQAPTIKDAAEYNAYVNAIQQTDNNAKISALEAFLTQYPGSVMKSTALELLMGTYQQTGNQAKVVDTAKRLLAADPNSLRALALLTYMSRQGVMMQQNTQQNLSDLQTYCAKGLDAVKANQKPAGMKDEDFDKLKKETTLIFNAGCGFGALQSKDYQHAVEYLKAAVDQDPNDLQNVYPLGTAYNSLTPADTLDALFYFARAAEISAAGSDAQKQILPYAHTIYKNYHGTDDASETLWNTYVLPTAKADTAPPADWGDKVTKYVPPTPAQQAHDLVKDKTPDQIKQLSFGEWELVLSAGTPDDQNLVWNVIKNTPLQMEGNVIEATSNTELHIAASEDDIEKKVADITLTMTGPITAARMPKAGDTFDFEGTPTSYTSTPFMMVMDTGKLLRKAGEPAPKKPPVRHRPVHRTTSQ